MLWPAQMRRLFPLVVLIAACQGRIGLPPSTPPGTPPVPVDPGIDPVEVNPCDAPRTFAAPRIVKLNHLELVGTYDDLAGPAGAAAAAGLEPDTRVTGFSTGADQRYSETLVGQLHRIAEPVANQMVADAAAANRFNGCTPGATAAATCARQYLAEVMPKAWRRDVDSSEVDAVMEVYTLGRDVETTATDAERLTQGLSWALRAVLQSPNLLYRTELGVPSMTGDEIASALSYATLGRPPDAALRQAASAGELATAAQRLAQVERLKAADPASWTAQLRRFTLEWTEIDLDAKAWAKQTTVYPSFDSDLKEALRQESVAATDDWLAGGSTLTDFLTAKTAFVNRYNAPLYGLSSSSDTLMKTTLTQPRAGFLTLPGFLGTHADPDSSSPVLRGSTVIRRFLCLELPGPPPNVPPLPPSSMSTAKTTRERFAMHTQAEACAACHQHIDPLGYPLENFDGIGAYRETENGVTVDASGAIVGTQHSDQPVVGAQGLATALLGSSQFEGCVSTQAFRYLSGRRENDADACAIHQAKAAVSAHGSVWDAFEALVADDGFVTRSTGAMP